MIVILTEEVRVEVDLIGDVLVDFAEEIEVTIVEDFAEEIGEDVPEDLKCIRQHAINAVKTVKFLSDLHKENLCIVMIVSKTKTWKLVRDRKWENHLVNTMTR